MNEIREDMLEVKRMITDVEIILGKREGETELVNRLIDAENLLTYCMSRLENAIVPPCKVGDTVYVISGKEILPEKVRQISLNEHGEWAVLAHFLYVFNEFGKTAFPTLEEAGHALKEGADNG